MGHLRPKSRWMICTMIYCIRPVFVHIRRVERCVCFWPSWLIGLQVHPQWLRSFQYLIFQSAVLMPLICAFCFSNLLLTCPVFSFCLSRWTRDLEAAHGKDFVILACTVRTRYSSVSDGRTDGQTDRRTDAQAMAKTREAFCYRTYKGEI